MPPKAFISYAWESDEVQSWVRNLATRLRGDGVDVTLDQWHLAPGDQLPQFMEEAVRTNDFVLIACTPTYRAKSDARKGGVGYEGDIMTAEVMADRRHRKFIPMLRLGEWNDSAPSWLRGKYFVDMRHGASETGYADLLATILGTRQQAPPVVVRSQSAGSQRAVSPTPTEADLPMRIVGVVVDEVTQPTLDGSPGSELYKVPFRLSRTPSVEWSRLFVEAWNHPPRWTSMHRPGIARVVGDKVLLDGTTMDEVRSYHRDTLVLAVGEANAGLLRLEERRRLEEVQAQRKRDEHEAQVQKLASDITFE